MNEGRDTSANKTHLFNWLHDMTVQMGRGRRGRGAGARRFLLCVWDGHAVSSHSSIHAFIVCVCVSLGLTSSHPSLRGCEPGTR